MSINKYKHLRTRAREKFWRRYKGEMYCVYCGCFVSRYMIDGDELKATIDHVIPLAYGGKSDYDNLVLSCLKCNRQRSYE